MKALRTGISRRISAVVNGKPHGPSCNPRFARFFAFFAALFFIFPGVLAAGGKKSPSDEEALIFWYSEGIENKETLTELIESYNARNESVPVRGAFQGQENDLYLKILSQEGTADIIEIPVQYLAPLQKKGYIRRLDTLLDQKLTDDIEPKFWDSVRIEGGVYAVPFYYSVYTLYVNQHILRTAGARITEGPETWEGLHAIAAKIKENASGRVPLFIPMEKATDFIAFVESYTGEKLLKQERMVVYSPSSVRAMRFLQQAVYKERLMPSRLSTDEGVGMFLAGDLGIMLRPSSMLVYIESNLPYDMNVWHLPSWEKAGPSVFGKCLAVVRSNPRKEKEAFRFVEWLVGYEQAINWHTHTGSPAIRSSVKESLDLLIFYEDNPNYMTSTVEIESGSMFHPSYDYFAVSGIIEHALESIMVNGEDPDAALKKAQEEIDALP